MLQRWHSPHVVERGSGEGGRQEHQEGQARAVAAQLEAGEGKACKVVRERGDRMGAVPAYRLCLSENEAGRLSGRSGAWRAK